MFCFAIAAASLLGAGENHLTLNPEILGMQGAYSALRVNAATGEESPYDKYDEGAIQTGVLAQWEIEGYLLTKR